MAMFEEMSTIEKEELIISLATLTLVDAKVEVSVCFLLVLMREQKENLDKIVKESGNKIAPYWSAVFASNCAGKDLLDVLAAPGAGAAAPAAGAAPAGAAAAAEEKKEEEEEEEEEVDMSGGGLFGGDDEDDW